MTYACMECGEGLPQYKAGYCARCIADEEAHEYEAEDADEGREECELEPDRMTHEGREYYRLADGVELSETDRHTFNRALFGPINWPRRQGQVNSGNMALGNEYWRPVEVVAESVRAFASKLDRIPPEIVAMSCVPSDCGPVGSKEDIPAFTSDRPKTVRALAKAHGHNLSRVRSQTHVVDSLTGKRLDTEQARDSSVSIPKDLARLVLAELSPQWHTKAVRELLRTIEEQL